jgi:hypothetical protein
MRSMQELMSRARACSMVMDFPWEMRIPPGVVTERKQQVNSSHNVFIISEIWS